LSLISSDNVGMPVYGISFFRFILLTVSHLYQIKMQWAEEGEKPSFFFTNLEANVFTNKTIPKLVNESGNVITDQNKILQEAKTYYENLYSKRDTVSNINLKNEIPPNYCRKI
jgi:hypothetical protein